MESLRSALQPLTHNLPAPITSTGRSLLGPFCYKTLILDIDPFASPECVKLAISKGLGIGIIGASAIVKVPQIIKLLQSESAAGVSFLSYVLESTAYLISLAYNIRHGFPFSTYGETALILAQNVVISSLVLKYGGKGAWIGVWVAGLAAGGGALFRNDVVDTKMLAWAQAAAGVLGVASKVPQIATIWAQGGTGQLSAFAVINYLLGSLSRIFTTLQEVPDPLILYGFVAGFALNAILFIQVLWYWNTPTSSATKGKSKSKSKSKSNKLGPASTPAANNKTQDAVGTGSSSARTAKSPSTRRRG